MQMRGQEETVTAAKVEVSLKELQDKLQRDRRDQDSEEARLKLESRAQELETRLAQERETWVATLKSQVASRETQDKEVETHFAVRLQEMERRWLEEKARWQKISLAKDDEVRTLRALAEKLRGADTELAKSVSERNLLDKRLNEVMVEREQAVARLQGASDREKESIQLRADLTLTRQQGALIQERLERELAALRHSAREREERLMADQERLQRDLGSLKQNLEVQHDANLRRAKAENDVELLKYKDLAEKAKAELQRLRTVAGALERQGASSRVQLDEMRRAAASWEKTQERYKAEFVVLQRKWVEREKEVRAEATQASLQMVESEKMRLRVQAQDELNQRAAKIADQLRLENESEQKRLESRLRADLEGELAQRRQAMIAETDAARAQAEQELGRLRRELQQKDASWGERMLAKEAELIGQRSRADELAGRLSHEETARTAALRDKLELEKQVEGLREQLGAQQASLRAFQDRLSSSEADKFRLESEKSEFERLSTAQAAQVQSTQEAIEATRLQLARETQTGKILQNAREQAEKTLAAQRAEMTRSLHAQKVEFDRVLQTETMRAEAVIAKMAEDACRRAAKLQSDVEAARGEIADLSAKLEECRKESLSRKPFKTEGDSDHPA